MKKIIAVLISSLMLVSMVGCGTSKTESDPVLQEDVTTILDTIYERAELDDEFRQSLEHYQKVEITEEISSLYFGETDVKFTQGVASAPMMSSVPYELVLFKVEEGTDIEALKTQIKENADPRKWICVEAEEVIVENIDDTVMFLMANSDVATPIKEAFMSLSK